MPVSDALRREEEELKKALALSFGEFEEHKKAKEAELDAALQISREEEIADPRKKNHLSLSHYPSRSGRKDYFKIKVPGDGNCGFYAISLGIITLLVQDKLKLSTRNYIKLMQLLHKGTDTRRTIDERIKFYERGYDPDNTQKLPRLPVCVPYIKEILAKIDSEALDTDKGQLKQYILEKMHSCSDPDYFLESLLIILGPTLRTLSLLELQNLKSAPLKKLKTDESEIDIEPRDCKDASEQQLSLLANFFDFTFQAYLKGPETLSYEGFTAFEAGQKITDPIALTSEQADTDEGHEDTLVPSPPPSEDEAKEVSAEKTKFSRRDWFEVTDTIQVVNSGGLHWDLLLPRETLQRPPFLFSHDTYFPSMMIEDQLDLEVTSGIQYRSRLPTAEQGQSDFIKNSYLLTVETVAGKVPSENPVWSLRYINQHGEHESEIKISSVNGLNEILPTLCGKDPGSLNAEEKGAIHKVIDAYHRTTVDLEKKEQKFNANILTPDLERLLKKARADKGKLNALLDQITSFERAINLVNYQQEGEHGNRLAKILRANINAIMDDTIADRERIAHFQIVASNLQTYINSRPEIPRDSWNILYNIVAGVITAGLWHCYNRCKYKQWTLFHDFTPTDIPSFKALRTQFDDITAQLQVAAGLLVNGTDASPSTTPALK